MWVTRSLITGQRVRARPIKEPLEMTVAFGSGADGMGELTE